MLLFLERLRREDGQDLAEYGLLAVLVSLGCIAAMQKLASGLGVLYNNASATIAGT